MRKVLVFAVVFLLHSVAQFAAWSYVDSPKLNSTAMRTIFTVLVTPIALVWGSISSDRFWIPMIANSALWAFVAMYVYARLREAT